MCRRGRGRAGPGARSSGRRGRRAWPRRGGPRALSASSGWRRDWLSVGEGEGEEEEEEVSVGRGRMTREEEVERGEEKRSKRRPRKERKKENESNPNSRLQVLGIAQALDLSKLSRLLGLAHGGIQKRIKQARTEKKRRRRLRDATTAVFCFRRRRRENLAGFFLLSRSSLFLYIESSERCWIPTRREGSICSKCSSARRGSEAKERERERERRVEREEVSRVLRALKSSPTAGSAITLTFLLCLQTS